MTENVLDTSPVVLAPLPREVPGGDVLPSVLGPVVVVRHPVSREVRLGWPGWAITDPDVIAGIAERVQWYDRWLRWGPRPAEPTGLTAVPCHGREG